MSVNGRFDDISAADLLEVGTRFGVGSAPALLEEVRAAIHQWPQFAEAAGVPREVATDIGKQHRLLAAE
jgi:serine/threonine-protein kinase HipA